MARAACKSSWTPPRAEARKVKRKLTDLDERIRQLEKRTK